MSAHCRRAGAALALALVASLAWPRPVAAQAAQSRRLDATDTVDWHVVEAGETLEIITRKYLGTKDLWYENWRLNPQIEDPDLLQPGQRIRVIKERLVPARRAELQRVANDVDKNPQRQGWIDAAQGDLVEAPAGIRTSARSSAQVALDEGSALTLTEYTQIFLKEMTTTLTGVQRGAIEIERGQADLDLRVAQAEKADIEIIMGGTVARPRVGAAGRAETRARTSEAGGGAQVMVYGGSSEVAAGGRSVAVPTGMGTSVPEGGVPAPPEKLLPRPVTIAPRPGSTWAFRNPRFAWQPVRGARSYTLEVCADPACAGLVARVTGLEAATWDPATLEPPGLAAGSHLWRVTAVARSGLDGYPSRPVRVTVAPPEVPDPVADWVDIRPPAVVAMISDGGIGAVRPDGALVLGAGARIRLEARDDAAGVAAVRYRWNGGRWLTWRGGDLPAPSGAGPHRLEVEAEDRLGRRSAPWQLEVVRDAETPAAPAVERVAPGG